MPCTSLVATGSLVEGGGAYLVKVSDTLVGTTEEYPIHLPSQPIEITYAVSESSTFTRTLQTYAYSGAHAPLMSGCKLPIALRAYQTCWGMNERGLGVAYTQLDVGGTIMVPAVTGIQPTEIGLKTRGRELATLILAFYETVDEVLADLVDPTSIIGQNNRANADSVEVIDRFGNGVVIEVSAKKACWKRVINDYFPEDNVNRLWTIDKPDGPTEPSRTVAQSGTRTVFIKEAADKVLNTDGIISYRKAIQYIARYVQDMEQTQTTFENNDSVNGVYQICNDGTNSSFVAVSGDQRYEGKLNCFWGEYGNPPFIGIYTPHNPYSGIIPESTIGTYTMNTKKPPTRTNDGLYISSEVRAIQYYAFAAEEISFTNIEQMLNTIPDNLSPDDLKAYLSTLTSMCQKNEIAIYKSGIIPLKLIYTSTPLLVYATIGGLSAPPSTIGVVTNTVKIQVPTTVANA